MLILSALKSRRTENHIYNYSVGLKTFLRELFLIIHHLPPVLRKAQQFGIYPFCRSTCQQICRLPTKWLAESEKKIKSFP